MVSTVPSPSWSSAPPSRMKSWRSSGAPAAAAICSATVSSCSQLVLAAPAVEAEGRAPRAAALDEDRAGVAQPDVAEPAAHDLDAGHAAQQRAGRRLAVGAADQQAHPLAARAGQGAGQGRDLGLGGRRGRPPTAPHGWGSPATWPGAAPIRRERRSSSARALQKPRADGPRARSRQAPGAKEKGRPRRRSRPTVSAGRDVDQNVVLQAQLHLPQRAVRRVRVGQRLRPPAGRSSTGTGCRCCTIVVATIGDGVGEVDLLDRRPTCC